VARSASNFKTGALLNSPEGVMGSSGELPSATMRARYSSAQPFVITTFPK
jgi:hypothetical protein